MGSWVHSFFGVREYLSLKLYTAETALTTLQITKSLSYVKKA